MANITDEPEDHALEPWSEPAHQAANQYERRPAARIFVLINILMLALLAVFIGIFAIVTSITDRSYVGEAMAGLLPTATFLGYLIIMRGEIPRIKTERLVHAVSLALAQVVLFAVVVIIGFIVIKLGVSSNIPGHTHFTRGPLLIGLLMSPAAAIAAALIATIGLPDAGAIVDERTQTDEISSNRLT